MGTSEVFTFKLLFIYISRRHFCRTLKVKENHAPRARTVQMVKNASEMQVIQNAQSKREQKEKENHAPRARTVQMVKNASEMQVIQNARSKREQKEKDNHAPRARTVQMV